eukprot:TRINITY_DN2667_c1_g1_i1.p1 TRINITY_DN2667_c1_g1~~TRINITY_DN2667_c1_g1_i1.p1  ORF type:complete len:1797 (+),score=87.02 TRINITY_DN2667_c1_g1_i1:526-5391(+)
MESGNRELGVQLLPRDIHGRTFDIPQHGFSDLYFSMHSKFGDYTDNLNSIEINISPLGEQSISQHFHHLFFSLRTVVLQMLFDTEMFVSIYSASLGKRISEQYRVCMDQKGVPKDQAKLLKTYSIFTNLETRDIQQELYLMIEIVRFGPFEIREAGLVPSSLPIQGGGTVPRGKNKPQNMRRLQVFVRRPYAVGLFPLNDVFALDNYKEDEDVDHLVTMYQCLVTKEGEYHNIPQHIFSKNDSIVAPLGPRGSGGVFINIKPLHGTLEEIRSSNSYLFTPQTAVCDRLSFPEIILPEMKRNDLYIRLKTGSFPKYTKKTDKNLEIEVQVKRNDGSIIQDCILPGNGEPPLTNYFSTVFYHNGRPVWNDIIKLSLPANEYCNSHIEFLFRHKSNNDKDERPFSLAFLRLMREDGTLINDGDHDMMVYKVTSSLLTKDGDMPKFLGSEFKDLKPLVPLTRDEIRITKDHIANREIFLIETIACSTMLTKNVNILNILSWQKKSGMLPSVLTAVKDIPDEDMVLFLDELLHAIFRLLNEEQSLHHSYALAALIHLLSLLSMEKKYFHFKKYLDQYCDRQFYSTMAYRAMLAQSMALLQKVIFAGELLEYEQTMVRKFFKAVTYFLKFVIKSRLLHVQAMGVSTGDQFESELLGLLDLFVKLMKIDSKDNISLPVVQAMAIQNIPYCFPDLISTLPPVELSLRLGEIMSVGREDKLIRYRLIYILHTIRSSIMLNTEARCILFPKIVYQIVKYLRSPQLSIHSGASHSTSNLNYAVLCMLNLYSLIYGKEEYSNEIQLLCKELMPALSQILQNTQLLEDTKFGVHIISSFIGLLDCIQDEQFSLYMSMDNFPSAEELEEFISHMFNVISLLLENSIYPVDWMIVQLRKDFILLTKITSISDALDLEVLCISENNEINKKLWLSFFKLSAKFCLQEELQLEFLSEFSRQNILERYGDMRITMIELMVGKWRHIEKFHFVFIPSVFEIFLHLSLLPPKTLRTILIPLFYDIMKISFREEFSTFKIESEFIDKFDTYISGSSMGDTDYVLIFNTLLKDLFQKDEVLSSIGTALIKQLTDLLVRLMDFKTVERQFDAPDIKMKAMFNLLNYYKEMGRDEMYIRYIYRFCKMLVDRSYFIEAGYTLLLHADVLNWTSVRMKPVGDYPAQSESERKERLYLEIIDYFDKGKMWEYAIEQAKKLTQYYETQSFSFSSLASMYNRIASFYSKIIDEVRPSPEYFRVAFYGMGFPQFIQNSQFIYRGLDFENLQSFNERLSVEFPNAKIMKTLRYPDVEILESDDQYLQSCKVDPICEIFLPEEDVNERIKSFYKVNSVCRFRHSRPFHKGEKDKSNEFKTLWLERTIYVTNGKFPGLLKSFPVKSSEIRDVSPLEYALETVESSSMELKELISSIKSGNAQYINQLSMRLNGIIDAAVMGGLKNYEDAFFTEEYLLSHPDKTDDISLLKAHIREQIEICQEGIRLHGKLCEESLYPFHQRIESQFSILKKKYYTGKNRRDSNVTESVIFDQPNSPYEDLLVPQSRTRENSYSAKSTRVSTKTKAYGKQISITGKVLVKTSLPTKSVSSISEDDELEQGRPQKPLKPISSLKLSDAPDLQLFENFNRNNSSSNC